MTKRVSRRTERFDGARINWLQRDGSILLYDEDDPDAWISMAFTSGSALSARPYAVCDECGLVSPQRVPPGAYMICEECGTTFTEME